MYSFFSLLRFRFARLPWMAVLLAALFCAQWAHLAHRLDHLQMSVASVSTSERAELRSGLPESLHHSCAFFDGLSSGLGMLSLAAGVCIQAALFRVPRMRTLRRVWRSAAQMFDARAPPFFMRSFLGVPVVPA